MQAIEILLNALHARGRLIERRHLRSTRGELCGLAARCGAEIEHRHPRDIAEETDGQSGGGILHPPGAIAKTVEGFDANLPVAQPDRTGVQNDTAQPCRPFFRIGLNAQIERRFNDMRGGDLMREPLAIILRPAPPQKLRDIEMRLVDR